MRRLIWIGLVVALLLYGVAPAVPAQIAGASVSFTPLSDLAWDADRGIEGGLYPGGQSRRPDTHTQAGLAEAQYVVPCDRQGVPDPNGKIVLLSIGMSNTSQEFSAFQNAVRRDAAVNPRLVLVNGAQGSMTAARIRDPLAPNGGRQFWMTVDERLAAQGVTAQQVQVVWLKQANSSPSRMFPYESLRLEEDLEAIIHVLKAKYPYLRLVYLSSRIYAGYANTPLNPEPFAYESGFSVKWLIERQIQGAPELNWDPALGQVRAPWLSWGPYLWADGGNPRSDGLLWERDDLAGDGTHPSDKGRAKVAELLLSFLKTDETARRWFVGSP